MKTLTLFALLGSFLLASCGSDDGESDLSWGRSSSKFKYLDGGLTTESSPPVYKLDKNAPRFVSLRYYANTFEGDSAKAIKEGQEKVTGENVTLKFTDDISTKGDYNKLTLDKGESVVFGYIGTSDRGENLLTFDGEKVTFIQRQTQLTPVYGTLEDNDSSVFLSRIVKPNPNNVHNAPELRVSVDIKKGRYAKLSWKLVCNNLSLLNGGPGCQR